MTFSRTCFFACCCVFAEASSSNRQIRSEPLAPNAHSFELKADGGLKVHDAEAPSNASVFRFWGHLVRADSDVSMMQQAPVLQPPSTEPQHSTLGSYAASYSQYKQDLILLPILGKLGKGFFVESGAIDGDYDSNSLYYELNKGWAGILVEPDPRYFSKIQSQTHRHAYAFNGCLSPSDHAETIHFGIDQIGLSKEDDWARYSVPAQPLHALVASIGRSTVDFWSLDIEGSEGRVLKATDFSKVEVGVMLIEMNKAGENIRDIRQVMDAEGFVDIGHTNYPLPLNAVGVLDHIFINPKYFLKRGLEVPTEKVLAPENRN